MKPENKIKKNKRQKTATIQDLKDFLILESKHNRQQFEKNDERFEKIDRRFNETDQRQKERDIRIEKKYDEIMKRLDLIAGVIQDMRTENAATTYFLREHENKIIDHEGRITVLEQKITT